jgi:membrane protein DedA with SNARE-associated domain
VLDSIALTLQGFIRDIGYPGLFLLIVLESTFVPLPSLLVMPFAGFLASRGEFSLPWVLAINSAGALTGSSLSYAFGAFGGKPLLLKYGKYVLIRPADLEKTETFFAKHGAWTVFIGRFVPVVRHVISVPAGIARMPLRLFLLQTFLGSAMWGGGLIVFEGRLGDRSGDLAHHRGSSRTLHGTSAARTCRSRRPSRGQVLSLRSGIPPGTSDPTT